MIAYVGVCSVDCLLLSVFCCSAIVDMVDVQALVLSLFIYKWPLCPPPFFSRLLQKKSHFIVFLPFTINASSTLPSPSLWSFLSPFPQSRILSFTLPSFLPNILSFTPPSSCSSFYSTLHSFTLSPFILQIILIPLHLRPLPLQGEILHPLSSANLFVPIHFNFHHSSIKI